MLDALVAGETVMDDSTGTGVAPFASLMREPEVYENFDDVILTHTCRDVAELTYSQKLSTKPASMSFWVSCGPEVAVCGEYDP